MTESERLMHYQGIINVMVNSQCNFHCFYCMANKRFKHDFLSFDLFRQAYHEIMGYFWHGKPSILTDCLNRSGKVFRVDFTGGEPFLVKKFTEICVAVSRTHIIDVNTNNVLPQVREFSDRVDPKRVAFVNASVHFFELKRLGMFSSYIGNFLYLRKNGFNVQAVAVAHPSFMSSVGDYLIELAGNDIHLKWLPYFGTYNCRDYPRAYDSNCRDFFNFTDDDLGVYNNYGRLCNAGKNAFTLLPTGEIRPCYSVKRSCGNVYSGIKFSSELLTCPVGECGCPFMFLDKDNYDNACK